MAECIDLFNNVWLASHKVKKYYNTDFNTNNTTNNHSKNFEQYQELCIKSKKISIMWQLFKSLVMIISSPSQSMAERINIL